MAEGGEGDAKYLAALLAANEAKWNLVPKPAATLQTGQVTQAERPASEKPDVAPESAGSLTIDLLRKDLEMQAEELSAKKQECEKVMAKAVPSEPDSDTLKLLVSCGLPEEKAHEVALAGKATEHYRKRASTQAALDYFQMLETSGTNFESLPYLSEAIGVYDRQFTEMARLLGVDLSQPSQLDPRLTIGQEYRRRLTPIPAELKSVFLNSGTRATVRYRRWYSEEATSGIFFTFSVEYNKDKEILKVTHKYDQTKTHEDSHFLALAVKGEEKYYHGNGLGMLGEGLAPIFELWFAGSVAEGKDILTETSLVRINKGESPVEFEKATNLTPSSSEWWDKAKGQASPVVYEATPTTRISAEIMKFMQNNPDITFARLYQLYLRADTLDDFFGKIEASGIVKIGVEESKEAITKLCWSVDREENR